MKRSPGPAVGPGSGFSRFMFLVFLFCFVIVLFSEFDCGAVLLSVGLSPALVLYIRSASHDYVLLVLDMILACS